MQAFWKRQSKKYSFIKYKWCWKMYQSWKYVGNLSLSSRFITKPVRDPDEYFYKQ